MLISVIKQAQFRSYYLRGKIRGSLEVVISVVKKGQFRSDYKRG